MIKIGINGFGRIGRLILRALLENYKDKIKVVAINDLGSIEANAHLIKYDSTHGTLPYDVETSKDGFKILNQDIKVFNERDPANLPWGKVGVDVVLECTGLFLSKETAEKHIKAGAKKVIISAPAGKDIDATIVYGVNHGVLKSSDQIISNASCTTNCLAPLVKPLHEKIGIKSGIMTTIHSYTNDQVLTDVYHSDLRRARSATQSMIPTSTGAAAAVGLVLPELDGLLEGYAVRVPTINVSLVDLTFCAGRETSVEEVDKIMRDAAAGELNGILEYNEDPLVSVDFNHNPASSIFESSQTKVVDGTLVKVLSWYDNEWGFSNRMIDTTVALMNANG